MIIPDNFITVTSANDVDQFCSPLKRLGISYFHSAKIYKDGSVALLVNNAEWHQHVFKKEKPGPWPTGDLLMEEGCYLWDSVYHHELVSDANNFFEIDSGVVLVKKYQSYYDVFSFGATKGKKDVINFCFNNIDILEKFTIYFKEKLASLIQSSDKTRIIIPNRMKDRDHLESVSFLNADNLKKQFLSEIGFSNEDITIEQCKLPLRKREIDVLNYISKGKTAKETGNILGLAPRTVERYLANAKERLDCYSKSQLVDLFLRSSLETFN